MQNYINNYDSYNEIIVYDFNIGNGGIGDCIKYFMYILDSCIRNNIKLHYKKNNIELENYIKLKYEIMYINNDDILNNYKIVNPSTYYTFISDSYSENNNGYCININDVFYFSREVIVNSQHIFPPYITDYISIHLRLGDKFLELEKDLIHCKEDTRNFSEDNINKVIEENTDKYIFFCCDNNSFRQNLKEKYNNIIISNGEIGHTSYTITSNKQMLDTITEFYILTKSKKIYGASQSGFSIVAANFNNIPYIKLYDKTHYFF
jgi:hypothetical protein